MFGSDKMISIQSKWLSESKNVEIVTPTSLDDFKIKWDNIWESTYPRTLYLITQFPVTYWPHPVKFSLQILAFYNFYLAF